jgi:hypothetical protein
MKVTIQSAPFQYETIRKYLRGEIELLPFYSKIVAALAATNEQVAVVELNQDEIDWICSARHNLTDPLVWWVIAAAQQIGLLVGYLTKAYGLSQNNNTGALEVWFRFDEYVMTVKGKDGSVSVDTISALEHMLLYGCKAER